MLAILVAVLGFLVENEVTPTTIRVKEDKGEETDEGVEIIYTIFIGIEGSAKEAATLEFYLLDALGECADECNIHIIGNS